MSAYLNALMEEGSRETLLQEIAKLYAENERLRTQSESVRTGWISVMERLPANGDVLCARNDGGVDIYRHDLVRDYSISDEQDTRDSQITHWMPLPEAPQ